MVSKALSQIRACGSKVQNDFQVLSALLGEVAKCYLSIDIETFVVRFCCVPLRILLLTLPWASWAALNVCCRLYRDKLCLLVHACQSCGYLNDYVLVFLFREDILDLPVVDESVQVIEEELIDYLVVLQVEDHLSHLDASYEE